MLRFIISYNLFGLFTRSFDKLSSIGWHENHVSWKPEIQGSKDKVQVYYFKQDRRLIAPTFQVSFFSFIVFEVMRMVAEKRNRKLLRIWYTGVPGYQYYRYNGITGTSIYFTSIYFRIYITSSWTSCRLHVIEHSKNIDKVENLNYRRSPSF